MGSLSISDRVFIWLHGNLTDNREKDKCVSSHSLKLHTVLSSKVSCLECFVWVCYDKDQLGRPGHPWSHSLPGISQSIISSELWLIKLRFIGKHHYWYNTIFKCYNRVFVLINQRNDLINDGDWSWCRPDKIMMLYLNKFTQCNVSSFKYVCIYLLT